jgi:hypothetical protein
MASMFGAPNDDHEWSSLQKRAFAESIAALWAGFNAIVEQQR